MRSVTKIASQQIIRKTLIMLLVRILIVEDDHKIAGSIKRGLEQETYSVDVSYNGNEGFDLASTEDYDLIILDVMLPEMNGFEISSKLRKNSNHTPILMLTAKTELEDRIGGLNSGADDYLAKPFAFEELLARIRALLRRPHSMLSEKLECGNLVMETLNFKVQKYGNEIQLSKKEYSLLEYLMRNKNKVLSKDQIISHVWNYDSDILPNTVEQYIGYLRLKIGKPNIIHTIRGFGYTLRDK